jgi:hypothetical protein
MIVSAVVDIAPEVSGVQDVWVQAWVARTGS